MDELEPEWISWGNYEFAPAEATEITYPDTYTGYAFTGLRDLNGNFVIAKLTFTVGETDPRDINPCVTGQNLPQYQITKIVAADAPLTGKNMAYLQLVSEGSRWTYRSWPVVCNDPETLKEELLGTHSEAEIVIVESFTDIDWDAGVHIFWQ